MTQIKMKVKNLNRGQCPETVGEALELMRESGNYPSYSTMRREIERQNLPEMGYHFSWGGWKFNLIVERYNK